MDILSGKGIRPGVGQGKIHFCGFGCTEITVRAAVLHLVKCVTEHLVVRLLAVEQEVDGFPHALIVNLAVQLFIDHLGALLRRDIAQQIGA